jgi:DNA polymerase III delta subunit
MRGQGLFNQTKWIILKHLGDTTSGGQRELSRFKDVLQDFIDDPETGTRLFLFDQDHPYRKGRQLGSVAESVQSSGGWSIIFWEPFEDSLRKTVQSKLSDAGLEYDPAALRSILERTRGKRDRVVAEVEKLIDAVDRRVEVEHVESIVSREQASDGFSSLKRNLVDGNPSELIRDFDEFWRRSEPPPRVVHVLYEFLDNLRTILQMTKTGQSLEDALDERGLPTSREVQDLFRNGLKWARQGVSRTLHRKMYELEKKSKYSDNHLDELTVEVVGLDLINPPGTR